MASKGKAVKGNYVLIWAGKTGRKHIKTWKLSAEQEADPSVFLRIFFLRNQIFFAWSKVI